MFATPHEYISIDYTDIYEESEDEEETPNELPKIQQFGVNKELLWNAFRETFHKDA